MRHTSNGPRCRTSILIAIVAIGMACTAANAAVTVIGAQYQQDNPYTEYQCWYHYGNYPTSCGSTVTGSNVSMFLKNTGGTSVSMSNVTIAGYSLSTILKRNTNFRDANSIYFYWDYPPQAIFDAGEPIWYRCDPNPIPAGGTARVVVRMRQVPVTVPVSMSVITSAGTVSTTIPVNSSDPVIASVAFSADRTKVYLTWRRSGGAGPTTIKMDDTDVTAYATTVTDANNNYAVTILEFGTALSNMTFRVFQGVYSDGKTATAGLRTWANPFIYGTWGADDFADYDDVAARAWIDSCYYRGINSYIMNSSGGLNKYMATSAGQAYAAARNYGYVKDSNVWGNNPQMWFVDDEPDMEEAGIACGTGLKLPCGEGHQTGVLGLHLLEYAETLRAINPSAPTTINLDGSYKPFAWYDYGQFADVMMVDTYFESEISGIHWDRPNAEPLYTKPTSVYACSVATVRAAEPNPTHVILYSCETKNFSTGEIFPFAEPASKRVQAYYALAGGAKGMAYWWMNTGWPCNGLNDWGAEALALWKEIGLIGAEIKTLQPQLVASHPVDIPLSPSTNVWAKALAHGTDTMLLLAVNNNIYTDTDGGFTYTSVANATVTCTLPSWMTSSPTAFEVRASGLYDISTSLNGSNLTVQLGTLGVTKMVVITTDSSLRAAVQSRYVSSVWPGVCAFASDHCVAQSAPPSITSQPVSTMAAVGESAAFSVTVTGSTPISYQWKKNGVNIGGATSATLNLTNVQVSDAGDYSVYVSNSYGSVTSNAATLSIGASNKCIMNADAEEGFSLVDGSYIANNWTEWESTAGVTTGYDESITVHGGNHAQRIRVWGASGSSGGCYQRMPATNGAPYTVTAYINAFDSLSSCYLGVDPSGGTNPASGVTWSSVTTSQSWVQKSVTVTAASSYITVYYKVVSGDTAKHNGYFDDATPVCQAVTAPSITQQPSNQIVGLGGTANFSVTADGTPTLTYQWKKNGTNISGATSASLQITNVDLSDQGSYTCYVANDYGNVTSDAATLTVTTSGNLVNANFETGTAGNPPAGWTTYIQSAKSGNWTIQTAGSQEGTQWQQTQVYNTGAYGGVRQVVTGLASGTIYTVTGFYRTNSESATASVRYNLAGNTDRANSTLLVSKTDTNWTSFSGNVTATGTSLMLFLDNLNGAYSNKASGFDNLRVASMPVVTQQPAPASVCAGANVNFIVAATGGGTLTYQWQKNSVNVNNGGHYSGCTTATLTITGADTNDAANYRCVITNPSGSVNSNQAALTIKTATSISAQPAAQSVCSGSNATFSITAAGDGALVYQWQKNSVNLTEEGHYSGVTTATLLVSPADSNDTGNYRCVVTGGCGSATSSTAALSLKTATAVTGQPTDASVCPAANVTFSVTATGDGTVTYQWLKDDMYMSNGGHYSGVTTATLTITGADTNDAAFYACMVSANCGNDTSNEALLTIKAVTAITSHPSNATINGGQSANFVVAATGDGALSYQWQKNSVNISNGGHYSGCTTATLTVSSADTNDAANYRCKVTAGCGSATSNQATLTVNVCAAPTLTNGNFEYSTVGNPPYGWTTYIQSSKSGNWTIQTVTPPQGTRWQQTQVYNTGAFGGIRQNVTGLSSGFVYTISGSYRTNSTSATAAVRYNLAGNTDRANSTVLVSKNSTDWGTFSADVTATGASMMLFLDHQNSTSSNKAAAFDNIKVVCK